MVIKARFECFGCKRSKEKKEFKVKSIQGEKVYVCQGCGYYNSRSIFNN